MEGEAFEYQISTDDTKSWFDSVRTCKVNQYTEAYKVAFKNNQPHRKILLVRLQDFIHRLQTNSHLVQYYEH